MPTPKPRYRSPSREDLGTTLGGVLLLRIVFADTRDRARSVWTVRHPYCHHEYDIPGRQIRERERAIHEGSERGCYICSKMQRTRNLAERPAYPSEIDKRLIPMTAPERMAHCGRWV